MMASGPSLGQLALFFGAVSLVAIGGANPAVPEMHRWFVIEHGWLQGAEFARLFAIAQASPGPNVVVVGLLGFRVAGVVGACVATLAMCAPSALATLALGHFGGALVHRRWATALRQAAVPLTVGLTLGTGVTLAGAVGHGWAVWAIAGMTALGATVVKRPLAMLAVAAVLGVLLRL